MRPLAIFLPLAALALLAGQANHHLAPLQVHLFLGGLFVALVALRPPRRSAVAAVVLAGLWLDASTPVAFGTHAILFWVACLVIQRLRERLPRDELFVQVVVALFANLGLFLALSFLQVRHAPVASAAWFRLIVDLFFSEIAVAAIAPWFIALQVRSLALARLEPA